MSRKLLRTITKASLVAASLVFVTVPLSASAADTTISVDVGGVISTFTTSGTVTLGALTPDATGTQSINNDTVTVATNNSAGFTLTLEDADATVTLASGANSFAAGTGSPATPAALANNQWGWRVDGLGGFGAGPTSTVANGSPSALTFAAMPASGSPTTLETTSGTGSDVTEVWYSARANTSQPTGTYTDTVTYTATVN